mgnify:CR=1 FL=1
MKEAFDRGLAVGIQQIRTDSVFFRFKDETFEFTTGEVVPKIAKYNGCYYEAKVKDLRKLDRKKKAHHGR